jgi:ribonuclease BN (tRNA processing enzyme)
MEPASTRITFLGVGAYLPPPGMESTHTLVRTAGGTCVLVDCGWCGALRLRAHGLEALELELIFLTHCHQDHTMGLAGLLYERGMVGRRRPGLPPLRVAGPAGELERVVERTHGFLQAERFPEVWPALELVPYRPGETLPGPDYEVRTIPALHPVPAASLLFTDARSGTRVAFSGDTAPNPELPRLARGASLLIHEASLPPDAPLPGAGAGHSRAADAAVAARAAGVGALRLVHLHGNHQAASLAAARQLFPATELAREGETLALTPARHW